MSEHLTRYLVTLAGIFIFVTSEAVAQTEFDVRWNVREGLWSENASWVFDDGSEAEAPSTNFDEGAWIGNGGTAIVDSSVSDIVKLLVPNGTVLIQQGGSLKAVDTNKPSVPGGPSELGDNGTLRLSGNGSLTTVDLENTGLIELNSVDSSFNVTGDLNHRGTLALNITSAGTPKVTVGGAAALAGTIEANFDNSLNLAFRDSFEFLSGANSVANNGARVVIPDSIALDVGLDIQLTTTNSTAALTVRNVPVLTVNRTSGAAEISNVIGDPLSLTSYSVLSDSGLLSVSGWNSLATQQVEGWSEANPRDQAIAELNVSGQSTIEVDGAPLNLGSLYNGGATHPRDEDVTFEVSLTDGSVVRGLVEYVGPPNDLALRVDPATGEAEISHQSAFIDPFDVTGYSILSAAGGLSAEDWNSFAKSGQAGEGWLEANPGAAALAEINPSGSNVFDNGTEIALGPIFTVGGLQDLVFQFTTVTGDQVLTGTVEYGELGGMMIPGDCNGDGAVNAADLQCVSTIEERDIVLASIPTLAGDLDGNGDVAFPDFLVLSANFGQDLPSYTDGNIDLQGGVAFPDFLVLSANFGQVPAGGAAAAAVPEPSSLVLFGFVPLVLLARRRNYRK